jgi:hypothetical protein
MSQINFRLRSGYTRFGFLLETVQDVRRAVKMQSFSGGRRYQFSVGIST